nr:probable glutathione S-transferase [Ipomoea batatas]
MGSDDDEVVLLSSYVNVFTTRARMALSLKGIYECLKAWVFKTRDENAIKEEQIDNLKVLERELGEKLYFGGESIGFLDLVLVTYYTWFLAFEKEVKLSIEAECPKLIEWVKRCLQNESISNSLVDPLKLYDFVLHKRKIAGVH